jgi:hypothetical protein
MGALCTGYPLVLYNESKHNIRTPKTRRLSGNILEEVCPLREGGGTGFLFVGLFYKKKKKSNERTEEQPREPGFVIENLRFFESSEGFWNRLGLCEGENV